jgi:hypothetical protein
MAHRLIALAFAVALVPLGYCVLGDADEQVQVTPTRVEQRFALKYCYSQYRSQSDVARCLAWGG